MKITDQAAFRSLWVNIHLWLGLTLGVLGVFIGLTGSILVYDHQIDSWLNPQRYAVSGSQLALPNSEYVGRAEKALEGRARASNLRLPEEADMPLVVLARGRAGGGFYRVYVDPPTGRVLETVPGGGFIGWAHSFHENLTLREYMGREIVGLVGFAMLISSLSGIYLWWPRSGRLRQALGPRPGLTRSRNLHYLFGFYGSLVLAMLSFTGIWLAYPEGGRAALGAIAPVSPLIRNMQAPEGPRTGKLLTPDEAVNAAQSLYPAAKVVSLGLPAGPRGTYRVNLREPGDGMALPSGGTTVFLDPSSGSVLKRMSPSERTGGDKFLVMQRLLHNGDALGAIGRLAIFVVGLLPALLAVTGTMMWLRQRRRSTVGAAVLSASDD